MPKTIMAAKDLAASTEEVLSAAKEYSKAFSAKLYLVHVSLQPEMRVAVPPLEVSPEYWAVPIPLDRKAEADRLRGEHKALQDLGRELSDSGIDVTALALEGWTVEKLLEEMERLSIDLVIIGSHPPSLLRGLFVGSTTEDVMRRAHCPVLVLPPTKA
jgi:nucleotide-binding universal stress UspA family protein